MNPQTRTLFVGIAIGIIVAAGGFLLYQMKPKVDLGSVVPSFAGSLPDEAYACEADYDCFYTNPDTCSEACSPVDCAGGEAISKKWCAQITAEATMDATVFCSMGTAEPEHADQCFYAKCVNNRCVKGERWEM